MLREWYRRLAAMLHISGRDAKAFAASFLVALGIWLVYTMTQVEENELSASILVVSDIPGYAQKSSSPVTVSASCDAALWKAVTMQRPDDSHPRTVTIESGALKRKSDSEFTFSSGELRSRVAEIFGSNVTLKAFRESDYTVSFAVENHSKVAIRPLASITYHDQFMSLEGLKTTPDSVIVYGDPRRLEQIDYVSTDFIRLKNLSASKNGRIGLDTPSGTRLGTDKVSYTVDVLPFVEISRKDVKVSVRNAPQGRSLMVLNPFATVTFRCLPTMQEDRTMDVEVFVDYDDFVSSRDGSCVARHSDLPSGVLTCSVEPEIYECMEEDRR